MKASIITIGDELLYGQTIDTNSAWIGQQLAKIGVPIHERIAVGDAEEDIISALDRAQSTSKFIIITGGLGPTKDDITKSTIVKYMSSELAYDEDTFQHIKRYIESRGRKVTDLHKGQAFMPTNAITMTNAIGTAPGMWMEHEGSYFLSMPGVPSEMKQIMLDEGIAKIESLSTDQLIRHSFIRTIGTGETIISQKIEDVVNDFPNELSIAYLPGLASVKLRITARGNDEAYLLSQLEKYTTAISDKIKDWVYAFKDEEIEVTLGKLCKSKSLTIGTAESCTGGAIAKRLTAVPGSSAYYEGSIVSYSNALKQNLLSVQKTTLDSHGAVSEETVSEMVRGAINALGVDIAVAVSGIAGPGGGTPDKPIGTVWLAVGNHDRIKTRKLQLTVNRLKNIESTTIIALDEVRRFILNN